MAPLPSQSTATPGRTNEGATGLSSEQREHLLRLWSTYERPLVDISLSTRSASESATALKLKQSSIPGPSYSFTIRLHHFFTAFLKNAHSDPSLTDNANTYTKCLEQSCLKSWALSVLKRKQIVDPSQRDENPEQSQMNVSRLPAIRLRSGRRVIPLPHEDFLNELNHFELQGEAPSPDFIRRESFGAFLYHLPDLALAAVGCAMAMSMLTLATDAVDDATLSQFLDSTQFVVRFIHVHPVMPMRDVKTGLVGKLVSVQGHVVKARPKRLRVATADYMCQSCAGLVAHTFDSGKFSIPNKCTASPLCKARTFTLMRSTARYINVQTIRLQESQDESITQAGRTPRQLQVELTHDDLVETCRPGDMVQVVATVAAINTAVASGQRGKRAQETSTYQLYLQGHSITTMSESNNSSASSTQKQYGRHENRGATGNNQVVYTQQQLQSIIQLCHADHRYFGLVERRAFPFDLLVRSLCPAIIGHDEVKAGLLLCLLGGTPPSDIKGHTIRSNAHILVVGDPGMGKSQMLLAASQLATRSVYVGGNTSSTTGLTVTLTKEEGGESGIEAGALVLADQGVCCVDEFDKMAKNHQDGLLEAMEQQQVSIAKAGVVASLPARCSLIAAANPKHGNYNMNKTVAENLNMAKPILSRFDLVFILRDRADLELDRMVSSNIMSLYRNNDKPGRVAANQSSVFSNIIQNDDIVTENFLNERMPLLKRLTWVNSFQKQPLPADLVRDYIAYARQYCKPKLTPEAAVVLKEYYMNLRYPADGHRRRDTVPITTRQLEALIRLCQARAKACLRDFVLREDALDVVELMSLSVEQVHSDESGLVDPIRGGAGGKSNRKAKKAFLVEIQRLVGIGGECSIDDLRRIADRVSLGISEFQTMIDDFRDGGVLMRKPNGNYHVLS